MGTPALIGKVAEDGSFVAARINYDGYPDTMGPRIAEIVARDGLDKMFETLFKYGEWSNLNYDRPEDSKWYKPRPEDKGHVTGYGLPYPPNDNRGLFRGKEANLRDGADYAYLMHEDGTWTVWGYRGVIADGVRSLNSV